MFWKACSLGAPTLSLAASKTFRNGRMSSVRLGILNISQCIADANYTSSPPVRGDAMLSSLSTFLGSSMMPCLQRRRPHHVTLRLNKRHLPSWSLKLSCWLMPSNCSTRSSSASTVDARMIVLPAHYSSTSRSAEGIFNMMDRCKWKPPLRFLCSTRVGV